MNTYIKKYKELIKEDVNSLSGQELNLMINNLKY